MIKTTLLSIFFTFLMLVGSVNSISLGSIVRRDFFVIDADNSVKFEILVWNVEETPYPVQFKVKSAPEGWFVLIRPSEFLLSSSSGDEEISLPYTGKNVKAKVVSVFVKPENAKPGEYEILIEARAGNPSQGIAFFQEREFRLGVKIRGEREVERENVTTAEKASPIVERVEQSTHLFLYIPVILLILAISLLIYKYA